MPSASPLPGLISESPPATSTISWFDAPLRTTVSSVASGAKPCPTAAADRILVVEAGIRSCDPLSSKSTSPVWPSRTTRAESASAGSLTTPRSARATPSGDGACASPARGGSGSPTEVDGEGWGTTGRVRVPGVSVGGAGGAAVRVSTPGAASATSRTAYPSRTVTTDSTAAIG